MRRVASHRTPAYKRREAFSKSDWMTLGTWLFTKMRGELVGTDAQGNRYFQDKRVIEGRRRKRWVIYNGEAEASRVPPDWHGWLHYTTNTPPPPGGLPRKAVAEGASAAISAAPISPTVRRARPWSTAPTSRSRLTRRGVRAERAR